MTMSLNNPPEMEDELYCIVFLSRQLQRLRFRFCLVMFCLCLFVSSNGIWWLKTVNVLFSLFLCQFHNFILQN